MTTDISIIEDVTARSKAGEWLSIRRERLAFSRALRRWFALRQRDLAFRRTDDPYAILVSEMMLQQTQVKTVAAFFDRFMGRFPDVYALAGAREEDVLAAWAGLGYYRRAKLLHAASRVVCRELGGQFPRSVEGLMRLPGIGRYTAGAVASFAFGMRVPLVDTNVLRVLARVLGIGESVSRSAVQTHIWWVAEELVPASDPRQHNYALMELGSLVCTPRTPLCVGCPVARWCFARAHGLQEAIPAAVAKPSRIDKEFVCLVLQKGEKFAIRRIPEGKWHAGMYEFPSVEVESGASSEAVAEALEQLAGGSVVCVPFTTLRYTVTRHRVKMHVYLCRASCKISGVIWESLHGICERPMGSAQKRIVKQLTGRLDSTGLRNDTAAGT